MLREYDVSSSGGDAIVTLAATANLMYYVTSISASVSNSTLTPGTCNLTVKFGSTTAYSIGITSGSTFYLPEILSNETANEAIEVKLNGSTGLVCSVNVAYLAYAT